MVSRPGVATTGGAGRAAWLPLVVLALAAIARLFGEGPAIVAGIACFLLGLPHGAGDENGGRIAPYRFYHAVAYLLSGAALTALFLAAPLAALAIFLLLSAWHVGRAGSAQRVTDWGIGSLLIGGSALFRPGETAAIFALLTGQAIPPAFMTALALIGVVGCACTMIAAWRSERDRLLAAGCVLAALAFHPVLAAGVIFLIGHALPVQRRQIIAYGLDATWAAVRWPLALAVVGLIALALAAMKGLIALPIIAALAFGFATPHMLAERIEP